MFIIIGSSESSDVGGVRAHSGSLMASVDEGLVSPTTTASSIGTASDSPSNEAPTKAKVVVTGKGSW